MPSKKARVLPFLHKPQAPNKNLVETIVRKERAILRLWIDTCLAWQRDALQTPNLVKEASPSCFKDADLLGQ